MSLYFEDEDIPRAKQTPSLQQQHTSADGSFTVKAKHFSQFLIFALPLSLISPTLLSTCSLIFFNFSLHQAFHSGSFPPFPCLLLPAAPSAWDRHRRVIRRRSYIQMPSITKNAFQKNWLSRQPCETESNIVRRFVTSPPEHQLALI